NSHGSALRMVFLDRFNVEAVAPDGANTVHSRGCTRYRGDARNTVIDRRAPDRPFIEEGLAAKRRVDDQVDLAALDEVYDVRPAFVDLVDRFDFNIGISQHPRRAARGDDLESDFDQIRRDFGYEILVVLIHADECNAGFRKHGTCADL